MAKGYIPLRRGLIGHLEDGRMDLEEAGLFSYLLMKARATGNNKGNLNKSLNELAEDIPTTDRSKLYRILRRLEGKKYISIKRRHKSPSTIRILKFYISNETQACISYKTQVKRKRNASETQRTSDQGKQSRNKVERFKKVKKEDIVEIISYLNTIAKRNFSSKTKATQKLINARLEENYSIADFKKVIRVKVAEWATDPEMHKYIRPETLFCASHFDSYKNQAEEADKEVIDAR